MIYRKLKNKYKKWFLFFVIVTNFGHFTYIGCQQKYYGTTKSMTLDFMKILCNDSYMLTVVKYMGTMCLLLVPATVIFFRKQLFICTKT